MTSHVTHLWRLGTWGFTLARRGAHVVITARTGARFE